ncbi:hypothetical protein J1N35_042743 [Gossypium stocksii]|uniref:Uncharacterized protein n=1 Tax=Gossypium stocksii TaxID=47602 RepID=A0A9D3U619_9ROSI|nr:hypothetical protein J1N35_042743 [Gossypium stocksii]
MKKVHRQEAKLSNDLGDLMDSDPIGGMMGFNHRLMHNGQGSKENGVAFDEDDIALMEGDFAMRFVNGVPSINFFDRVHKSIEMSIIRTMVIKLLGKRLVLMLYIIESKLYGNHNNQFILWIWRMIIFFLGNTYFNLI